jgi:hypothetical protein
MTDLERTVAILKNLLKLGMHWEMVDHIENHAASISFDVRVWRLYGVATGMLGEHLKARMCFLVAYEISDDSVDLANSITTFWPLHDSETAIKLIEDAFPLMDDKSKEIIAMSALEAVRVGETIFEKLPLSLRNYLRNVEVIVQS